MDESFGVDHINYSVLMSFYHGVQIFRLLFFVAICSAVCFYINYKIKRRRLEKIIDRFDGPKGYPLIGNVAEFFGPTTDVIKKGIALMKIYKSPFKIWLVHKPYVVVYTPEDFQTVAFKTMEKDSSYRFIVDMMGDGIFTSEVEKWKRHRRVINPAFNPNLLFHYFLQIFNEQNINLVKRLKKETGTGKHFDYWPYESQTSVITLCEVSMGYKDINTTEVMKFGNSLTKSAELVSKRFYQPWLMPSFIFTAYRYLFGYGNVFNDVRDLPLKMLKTRRELLQRMKNEDYLCTGQAQKYAMILMKAKISTLTRNFKITTDLKMDDIELKVDMVIRNIDGYQIKLEYRHGESLF